ncbi:IS701 family transposase [Bradyrhizobium sp. AZCC 1708]|uniref:IS701 family transposase n=1 Tax=Bradyrhizobium sp. AZCC 1708 TaxID=3117015 RepID=UPI002FF17FC5
MDLRGGNDSEGRFRTYVEGLASVVGHADRRGPLQDYCTGLMLPGARKSVEPMAARTAPARTAAQHQSLLHFVGVATWSDDGVLGKVRELVLPSIERHGPIEAWIIDDTSFPKQGRHSVGVHHHYCGQLGKQANCQVAVSLSIANHYASLPVAYRLYLPKAWAEDTSRRKAAGVPAEISFKTKQEIALEQIRWACEAGLPRGTLLLDAGYGNDSKLRSGITELGLSYVAGVLPQTLVWAPRTRPVRAPKKGRRDEPNAISVKDVALRLRANAWHTIKWREGTNEWLSSRFARVHICVASGHDQPQRPTKEWLLIEWPEGEAEPTKYWLSTLPKNIPFRDLVDAAKLRWRIERDYQELKQEVGLGHYEGRGWRGFHHHATLCIAAYGFLISERETISPSGSRSSGLLQTPALPEGYRPRGSALAA